jgi:hypothetical protein
MLHNIRRLKSSIRVSLRYKKSNKRGQAPFLWDCPSSLKKGPVPFFQGVRERGVIASGAWHLMCVIASLRGNLIKMINMI